MISIIVPVFNSEEFLEECLESLANQTSKDYEIIIVDDGSTDASSMICDDFTRKHRNVITLHTENQGPLMARIAGIEVSNGEYLMFVDSDDCLRSDAIEIITKEIIRNQCDIISFKMSKGQTPNYSHSHADAPLHPKVYSGSDLEICKESICLGFLNSMSMKAVSKKLINKTSIKDTFQMTYGEDFYQTLIIMNNVESIQQIDDVLYFYRTNSNSSYHNYKPTYLDDLEKLFILLLNTSQPWGEKYVLLAGQTVCANCFRMIDLISKWDAPKGMKVYELKRMRNILTSLEDLNLKDSINKLFVTHQVSLRLLLAEKYVLSYKSASYFFSVYFFLLRIRNILTKESK